METRAVKFLVVILAVMLVGVTVLSACAPGEVTPQAPSSEKHKIIWGGALDMTGPASADTWQWFAACQDYTKYINEEKGGIHGVPVEIIFEDDQMQATKDLSAYERFKEKEGILFIDCGSVATSTLYNLQWEDKIPALTGHVVDAFWDPGCVYGLLVNYGDFGAGWVDWCIQDKKERGLEGPPKLGAIVWDNSAGYAFVGPTTLYAEDMGVPFRVAWQPLFPVDLSTQLIDLRDWGVEYLMQGHTAGQAAQMLKDLYRLGLNGKIDIFLMPACMNNTLIDVVGDKAVGTKTFNNIVMGVEPTEEVAFIKALHLKNRGTERWMGQYVTCGLPSMSIFEEVTNSVLDKYGWEGLTGENLYQEISHLEMDPIGIGPIKFGTTPSEKTAARMVRLIEVSDDLRLTPASDWFALPIIMGNEKYRVK